jgi:hypothetical protein
MTELSGTNLIGQDIERWRDYYDEALLRRGVPAKYQYPMMASSNTQGEPVADSYSIPEDTHIFFDAAPKVKTYKRLGWVVENDKDLPFLIHCSFHLKNLQKDCLFTFSGQYTGLPDRVFRVIELTTDIQAPDHVTCQVVPQYDKQAVGETDREVKQKFNSSNHFLTVPTDYRGNYISEQPGEQ